MRTDVMTPGANTSRPIAMKKNDAAPDAARRREQPPVERRERVPIRALRGRQDASAGHWVTVPRKGGRVWRVSDCGLRTTSSEWTGGVTEGT